MRWPFHIIVTVAAGACRSRSGRGAKPLDSIFEFDREYDLGILSGTGAAPSATGARPRRRGNRDPVSSATKAGWAAGAGVEVAVAPHWSAKAEYLFVDLGNGSCTTDCAVANANGPSLIPNVAVKFNESVIRAGINYRFGS